MGKTTNKNLRLTQVKENDELYTRLKDIEKELSHYEEYFKDKTIYCNCDDYHKSQFYTYFKTNFKRLKLKRLICTCYDKQYAEIGLWGEQEGFIKQAYKIEITNEGNNIIPTELLGDGDFRSEECISLLKECDIVITNPPFSLLKDFIALMEEYEKKYLIVGNLNAFTYINVFHLFKNNKLWFGYNPIYSFTTPTNESNYYGNVFWMTNLLIDKRNEQFIPTLTKQYNSIDYPTYINYDAINVDNVKDIPNDYFGKMGVPISFIFHYNPSEFEIIGASSAPELSKELKVNNVDKEFADLYNTLPNRRKLAKHALVLCYYNNKNEPVVPYARLIIRRTSTAVK